MRFAWITVIAYATSVFAAPASEPGSPDVVEFHAEPSQVDTAAVALNIPPYEVEEAILLQLLVQVRFETRLISS